MVPYSMQHFILTGHARYVAIILLQSSITTNIVTFSQCILLCSLEINNQHHSLDMNSIPPKSFPPGRTYSVTIVVVITIMHKLTPRVMLWLTCTNILWQYVVTNIVVVVDVVCYCCRRHCIRDRHLLFDILVTKALPKSAKSSTCDRFWPVALVISSAAPSVNPNRFNIAFAAVVAAILVTITFSFSTCVS